MAIPAVGEADLSGSYDTSGEMQSTRLPGLQHKYAETALIIATNRCAVYCRYCFRKRLVGLDTGEVLERFSDAAKYIERHREIRNVLISGGDPLVLGTGVLRRMVRRLLRIEHLRYVRLGTRVPVTFPGRINGDPELTAMIAENTVADRRLCVVCQFNHPREITAESTEAVSRLIESGAALINQTVLLKGVNDRAGVLAELQSRLTGMGVGPYYLFQCRPVKRVKRRFQVPLVRGLEVVEKARRSLDGPSKRFRFVMSHRTGKVELLGRIGDLVLLKYHQARNRRNLGVTFARRLVSDACWLDDLPQIEGRPDVSITGELSR
jgi:KamA family protein